MYSRELDGEPLTLSASGFTYNSTFVLYDYESESMWFHLDDHLVAIGGPHAGRELATFPSTDASWGDWLAEHPDSLFLSYP